MKTHIFIIGLFVFGMIELRSCSLTKESLLNVKTGDINTRAELYNNNAESTITDIKSHANDTHYPLDGKCVTDTSVPLKNVLSNSIDKLERCNDEFLKNELGLNENTIEMNSPVDSSLEDCIKDTDDYHIMKMFELRDAARNCINNGQ